MTLEVLAVSLMVAGTCRGLYVGLRGPSLGASALRFFRTGYRLRLLRLPAVASEDTMPEHQEISPASSVVLGTVVGLIGIILGWENTPKPISTATLATAGIGVLQGILLVLRILKTEAEPTVTSQISTVVLGSPIIGVAVLLSTPEWVPLVTPYITAWALPFFGAMVFAPRRLSRLMSGRGQT